MSLWLCVNFSVKIFDMGNFQKLLIKYESFEALSMTIHYQSPRLIIEWQPKGCLGGPESSFVSEPDAIALQKFKKQLDVIKVWYWKPDYHSVGVLDGVQWHIEIDWAEQHLVTDCANAYPPKGHEYPSEAFNQFLRAVGELLDDRDFINTWYYNMPSGIYADL